MSVNAGDTAWLLISTATMVFMTPGLALYYGGMVRRKNLLSTFMMSFVCLGLDLSQVAERAYGGAIR